MHVTEDQVNDLRFVTTYIIQVFLQHGHDYHIICMKTRYIYGGRHRQPPLSTHTGM